MNQWKNRKRRRSEEKISKELCLKVSREEVHGVPVARPHGSSDGNFVK